MENPIKLTEKYERNGWPSIKATRYQSRLQDGTSRFSPPLSGFGLMRFLLRDRSPASKTAKRFPMFSPCLQVAAGFRASQRTVHWRRIGMMRFQPGHPMANGWLLEFMGTCILFLVKADCPKKLQTLPPPQVVRVGCQILFGLIVTVERNDADQLLLTNYEGDWPRALTTDTIGDHWDARPSPNGEFIVFNLRRFDDLNRLDIVLLEIATGKQTILYGKPSTRALSPKWSPDGKWISFISQESGREELYLIKPNGEGLHQLTKMEQDVFQYEWSPSGKQILAVVEQKRLV